MRAELREHLWGLYVFGMPLLLVGAVVLRFKSLPGPVYGGDLYFHNGIATAIFEGSSLIHDPTNSPGYAFYPWLYHLQVAVLGKLVGDVYLVSVYVMPFIILLASMAIAGLIEREIFERPPRILPLLPLAIYFPTPHPRTMLIMVMIPLFYLAWMRYLKERNAIWAVFTGLSWA